MKDRTSVRRYAAALFDLCRERSLTDAVRDDLQSLRDLLVQSSELARFLRLYALPRKRRMAVLRELFERRVHPLTWHFLARLEDEGRMGSLAAVCDAFLARCRRAAGVIDVRLTVSRDLEEPQVAEIRRRIAARLNAPIECVTDKDPALLGGFRVQADDVVYDFSVAGRLEALRARLVCA